MNTIDDLKYKLNRIWLDIRYPFRQFWFGLENLWFWIPKVWCTRDWDKFYLMQFIIWKLQRHCSYQEKHSHIVEPERSMQIETMSQCIALFSKINDEWTNYEEPAADKHAAKWGKFKMDMIRSEDHPGYELVDRSDDGLTQEELEQKRKEYLEGCYEARDLRMADLKKGMEIFVTNFDSWWD